MTSTFRRILPLIAAAAFAASTCAQAQFYKLHSPDVSFGGVGQFTTPLTSDDTNAYGANQQYTLNSAGFIGSLQDHPVPWAGVELNYGYTRFDERYSFYNYSSTDHFNLSLPTGVHEATAAYMFHPNFFHLQPFVNIGGGGLYFNPLHAPAQWRGAGLVEMGFDIPTRNPHFGFRIEGRSLYYRAPNFNTPTISTRSWVVTEEPSFSTWVRF